MILENVEIYIDKYKWNTESSAIVPSLFRFNSTSPHLQLEFGSLNCVNIEYYGTVNHNFQIGEINDYELGEVIIQDDGTYNYATIILNRYYTIDLQMICDAFNSYYSPNLIQASVINGSAIIEDYNISENITVPKAQGGVVEDFKDVNFFSDVEPIFVERINAKEYLIELGNLDYTFDGADSEKGAPNMYYEDSDIGFTVSGIAKQNKLKSFFEINKDSSYIGYMILIYYMGNLIWRGCVNQDSVTEKFCIGNDNKNIQKQGLGFLKEFQKYYSTQPIPNPNEIDWEYVNGMEAIKFKKFLEEYLFTNRYVTIEMESNLEDFYLIKDAGIFRNVPSQSFNYTIFKTSYQRIHDLHNENPWGFLKKICNAMGWIFFFYNDKLYIKNRSTEIATVINLDYNLFLEYESQKTKPQQGFDSIYIPDGEFYGGDETGFGDYLRGYYFYVFTKRGSELKMNMPFNEVGTGEEDWSLYFLNNHKFINPATGDANDFKYYETIWNNGNHNGTLYSIPYSQILTVDSGTMGNTGSVYWCENENSSAPHNYPADGKENLNDYDLFFTGNYGNALFKIANSKFLNYVDYVQTTTFNNNFQKYYNNNANNKITVKYKGLLLEPMVKFQIINNSDLAGLWVVNKFNFDFVNKTTDLELQLQNTNSGINYETISD